MGVELSRTRKKLVATASRRAGVYNRTGEPSVALQVSRAWLFCEKEEQGSGRMTYFLSQTKNKSEQSALCSDVVETKRIELSTLRMRTVRSPSWATPPTDKYYIIFFCVCLYQIWTFPEKFLCSQKNRCGYRGFRLSETTKVSSIQASVGLSDFAQNHF